MDEFTYDTFKIYENCRTPIFIMLMEMDEEHKREAESHIAMLKRVLKAFFESRDRSQASSRSFCCSPTRTPPASL